MNDSDPPAGNLEQLIRCCGLSAICERKNVANTELGGRVISEFRVRLWLLVYNELRTSHLRGSIEMDLPFVPGVGMHLQYKDMYPLEIKTVTWLADEACFLCNVEDNGRYDFDLNTNVTELAQVLDTLRDAKRYGWDGLDRIYSDV